MRPVRETIGTVLGREATQNLWFFTALFAILIVPFYGWLVARVRRSVLLPAIYGFMSLAFVGTAQIFGGGALDAMRTRDLFICLLEFEPDAAASPLFAADGVPWPLRPDDFSPTAMRVPINNQSGCQRFFKVGERAFTLYVVIGSHSLRRVLVPRVNEALAGVRL